MRIQETFAHGVWVFVGIGVSVVSAVVTSPPSNGTLDRTTSNSCEEDAKRNGGGV